MDGGDQVAVRQLQPLISATARAMSSRRSAAPTRRRSLDPAADAAVQFAAKVARAPGRVGAADLRELKSAGYDDAGIVEIVLHVALNVWTNYVNLVAETDIDFPVIAARNAA